MHTPVYLKESIDALNVHEGGVYIDATLGETGHTTEIARRGGRVLGIDWDEEQINNAQIKFEGNSLVVLTRANFADIEEIAHANGFFPADGILFDLGLSMGQLSKKGIGLSFKNHSEPLDMRLVDRADQTAADLLNTAAEDELYMMFAKNAEEVYARDIARAVAGFRKAYKFARVGDFVDLIDTVIPKNPQKSYARLFQALRIEVNREFDNLKAGLEGALSVLKPGGRMAIISFHSVEDRMVKQFAQSGRPDIAESYKVVKKQSYKFERSALLRVLVKAS